MCMCVSVWVKEGGNNEEEQTVKLGSTAAAQTVRGLKESKRPCPREFGSFFFTLCFSGKQTGTERERRARKQRRQKR